MDIWITESGCGYDLVDLNISRDNAFITQKNLDYKEQKQLKTSLEEMLIDLNHTTKREQELLNLLEIFRSDLKSFRSREAIDFYIGQTLQSIYNK